MSGEPESTTSSARKLPNLPPRELSLVKGALSEVKKLPIGLEDDKYVIRLLRIRNKLKEEISNPGDRRPEARKITLWGVLFSTVSSVAVLAFGVWHVGARYDTPLPNLDDPIKFLVLFGTLFLLAWIPLVVSLFRANTLRRESKQAESVDATTALSVFDVTVVKGLTQHESHD